MARGRHADKPTEIPKPGWKDILLRVWAEIGRDHVGLIAAGVAFYGLLALFPAITALIAISGLVLQPQQIINQLNQYSNLMPQQVSQIIIDQATAVAGSQQGGLGLAVVVGILLALYSASKGMQSLMEGLNVAYEEEETRGFFKRYLVTFALTLFLIVGIIIGLTSTMILPIVLSFLPFGPAMDTALGGLSYVVLALMTIFGLSVLYRYGPDRDGAKWRWLTPGSVLACVIWVVASIGFAYYVSQFGSYNKSFGTLAGAIVLLMWLWISAYIVLMGAELNAEIEAQTKHDTTVGKREPMGQRGAEKADNLGEARGA